MERHEIEERLRKIFVKAFGRSFEGTDHTVDSVEEWDSLSHVKLVLLIENEFGRPIDPDEMVDLYSSFGAIVTCLSSSHA